MSEQNNKYYNLTRESLIGNGKDKGFSMLDVILIVIIVLTLGSTLIQRVWLSPVFISGDSMNQTIDDADWLFVDKLSSPTYGDVIVIEITGETNYIKRVIAMSGDTVYMRDGVVYLKKEGEVDFHALDEPYAYYAERKTGMDFAPVTVEKNKVFVLGDNRCYSRDSRQIGSRSLNDVIGVVPSWSIKYKKFVTSYYRMVVKIDNFILSVFGLSSCARR